MTALELVKSLGADLVGRVIETRAIGAWPGGLARVIELQPDAAAPEIVFQVKHCRTNEECGVFAHEPVELRV